MPVSFPAHSQALLGRRAPVQITAVSGEHLLGEPVPDAASESLVPNRRSPLVLIG
jgi:hypothetical protein